MKSAVSLKEVNSHQFVKTFAAHLKRSGKVQQPKWVDIVKTGVHKQLPPVNADWFYVRAGMNRDLCICLLLNNL